MAEAKTPRNGFKRSPVLVAALLLTLCPGGLCSGGASAQPNGLLGKSPKILYYGWNTPTPEAVVDQAERLENSAFDAVVFKHSGPEQLFTHQPLPRAAFDEDIAALQTVGAEKLSESFLRMQVNTEDGWDWTSASDWAAFESNLRNYARLARDGGLKGILLDPEPYGFNVWNFETQPARDRESFEAVAAVARARGADFICVLKTEYPGITVFSLKIFSQSLWALDDDPSREEGLEVVRNDTFQGLWYGFVNGMVGELDANVRLIDGNEESYYYLSAEEFDRGKADSYGKLATAFLEPDKLPVYRARVEVAHAVYLDGLLNLANSPKFFGYYLADDAERVKLLEHNLFYGLISSDEYVWLYAEQTRWWDEQNVPPSLEPLVRRVANKVRAGEPLGFELDISAAEKAFDARVDINGSIVPNVPGISFTLTGLPDTACSAYNDGGKYSCTFPAGSTVTLTPRADGVTFEPPAYTYTAITEDNKPEQPYRQDFKTR